MHHFYKKDSQLTCEGIPLNTLAATYGTPLYVYSAQTIRDNYHRLHQALAPLDHEICYAVKANSNLAILDLFVQSNAGFDIVSEGELYRVLKAGGQAAKCTFAGVGKTAEEIAYALKEGVHCFNVESEQELIAINHIASSLRKKVPIAIRVNPNVAVGTHKFIVTGTHQNKFGIDLDQAEQVYAKAAKLSHLEIRGVQTHIGSQILDPKSFAQAISKLLPLVNKLKALYGITFFSVGGGIGIVYDQALASGSSDWWNKEGENYITPESYAAAIIPLLKPLDLKISFEPGRFLVGNAGVLLTTIQYIKTTPQKTFVVVDAAMNDLIRPALYEGWHEIVPLKENQNTMATKVDVVGPVCESGDFLAQDRLLPSVARGERLALMSTGAYGFSMASNYNSRPLPAEILIDQGRERVIRRRQSLDDLLQFEME